MTLLNKDSRAASDRARAEIAAGNALTAIANKDGNLYIDTISGLASINTSGMAEGRLCETLGHTTKNDKGGGVFYWNSASTATHDNATVVKPSAVSGAGRWLLIVEDSMNAAAWGIFPGAFATQQIRTAAEYCSENGIELIFNEGEYLLDDFYSDQKIFSLSKGLNLTGQGSGKTVFNAESLDGHGFVFEGSWEASETAVSATRRGQLDIVIPGSNQTSKFSAGVTIKLRSDDAVGQEATGSFYYPSEHNEILESTFDGTDTILKMAYPTSHVYTTSPRIKTTSLATGINLSGFTLFTLRSNYYLFGLTLSRTHNSVVRDVVIEKYNAAGIFHRESLNAYIENCTTKYCHNQDLANPTGLGYGASSGSTRNYKVHGCTFLRSKHSAKVGGETLESRKEVSTDVTFTNCVFSGEETRRNVDVHAGTNVRFIGCTIYGGTEVLNCDVHFSDCTFIDGKQTNVRDVLRIRGVATNSWFNIKVSDCKFYAYSVSPGEPMVYWFYFSAGGATAPLFPNTVEIVNSSFRVQGFETRLIDVGGVDYLALKDLKTYYTPNASAIRGITKGIIQSCDIGPYDRLGITESTTDIDFSGNVGLADRGLKQIERRLSDSDYEGMAYYESTTIGHLVDADTINVVRFRVIPSASCMIKIDFTSREGTNEGAQQHIMGGAINFVMSGSSSAVPFTFIDNGAVRQCELAAITESGGGVVVQIKRLAGDSWSAPVRTIKFQILGSFFSSPLTPAPTS